MTTLDLTIALSVSRKERNKPGCLSAIGADFASHVLVPESGSSDETVKIATDWGSECIDFKCQTLKVL